MNFVLFCLIAPHCSPDGSGASTIFYVCFAVVWKEIRIGGMIYSPILLCQISIFARFFCQIEIKLGKKKKGSHKRKFLPKKKYLVQKELAKLKVLKSK